MRNVTSEAQQALNSGERQQVAALTRRLESLLESSRQARELMVRMLAYRDEDAVDVRDLEKYRKG